MPRKDRIMKDLEFFTGLGHRRTGTRQNLQSAEYIAQRFRDLGMTDVTIEHPKTDTRTYSDWSLTVAGEEVPCYFINGSLLDGHDQKTAALDTEIVYVGDGCEEDFEGVDVRNRIVVSNVRWADYTLDVFRDIHSTGEICICDEKGTLHEGAPIHKDTYTPNTFPFNYIRAMEHGAAGFVGVLSDNCDHVIHFNEDYNFIFEMGLSEEMYGFRTDVKKMEIPGLWVSRSSGQRLQEQLSEDAFAKAKMRLSVERSDETANVVYGKLPGKSKDIILVHSHHDSVFEGAVQDGAAMSCVLEVACHFAQQPAESRDKTLMFAATDTHYTDYEGHETFIKNRLAEGENIILDVSLEHLGKEAAEGPDGSMQLTGNTALKLIYVTENEKLLEETRKSVTANGLNRAIVLPVNRKRGYVCSDGALFYEYGIPVVSLIEPVIYLMDPIDTLEMVDQDQLEPVTEYAIQVVREVSRSFDGKIEEEPCRFNGETYEKIHKER